MVSNRKLVEQLHIYVNNKPHDHKIIGLIYNNLLGLLFIYKKEPPKQL